MENILQKIIIYIKDKFNYEDEDEEFGFWFIYQKLSNITNYMALIYLGVIKDIDDDDVNYLTGLIYDNFEDGYYNECYELIIIDILEKYRGQTENAYFANSENLLTETNGEDEDENEDNWNKNNIYKFLTNMGDYINMLFNIGYKLINKVDFIESVIYDLINNPVCLK